jgi:3-deoxy-D-manno-octulosonic-acid transferase
MLLWFYRLAFVPVLLVLAPPVLWRMRRRGGYRQDFAHRFGSLPRLDPPLPGRTRVWLQAVSVGEVLAIEPLVDALLREPGVEIVLTTTTSTGLAVARTRYQDRVVGLGYFPLDWAPFSARAWARLQPNLVVLTEGERWPEHIAQAAQRGVPVVCVNARLSDRSFRRMRAGRAAVIRLLEGVTVVLAGSEEDGRRFRTLGLPPERVAVTGNLKLDVGIQELDTADRARLRRELGLGADEAVLLGSSTWPGEEAALLQAWQALRRTGTGCRLLLVPRHEERRGEIEQLLQASGVSYHFRSRGPAPAEVEVAVGDTTGELRQLTQLADLVFVGKSLPPHHEGQTPVEAAALGRPLLFGPRMTNFRAIARDLVAAGGAQVVSDSDALEQAVLALLPDAVERQRMGDAARRWQRANQGALARTLEHLRPFFHAPQARVE